MRNRPPLFQDIYELVRDVYRLVPTFPKAQRHVLGQRLELAAVTLLFAVDSASAREGRKEALQTASQSLDQVRLLLRLAHDLAFLSHDAHHRLLSRIDTLGRQLGGWLRQHSASPSATPRAT